MATCFQRVLETGEQIADIEISGETPARPGAERHWLVSWYPVRHDDEIVAVGAFVTDITERMRAERGLALLAEVGEALDATLGVDERLARLADLVVPGLADFCTISRPSTGWAAAEMVAPSSVDAGRRRIGWPRCAPAPTRPRSSSRPCGLAGATWGR